MESVVTNRWPVLGALLVASGLLVECSTEGSSAPEVPPMVTADGLHRVAATSGVLFVKPGHNIGGYDEIFFEPMSISYRRPREALKEEDEAALLQALERGVVERTEAAFESLFP